MGINNNAGSTSLVFILGAQRSGTTLLERLLSSHSQIKGGPEPHLLTPLAYLGYWGRVEKAPYDHVVAAIGQKAFIDALPNKEQDYWNACRSYCNQLYDAYMEGSSESICLDKTPEYATVWPFLTKVFPDAKYIVLTRHPAAIFSSFANSFFDGDFAAAQQHEPILERYIPALAGFLRQTEVPFFHLCYEDLVREPEIWMQKLYTYLDLPLETNTVEYGANTQQASKSGLGDPIGVGQHSRPTDANIYKWAEEFSGDQQKRQLLHQTVERLDPKDLATIGYPLDSFWLPLENSGLTTGQPNSTNKLTSYRMQRKLIVKGRSLAQRSSKVRASLTWLRLACDVMLREY